MKMKKTLNNILTLKILTEIFIITCFFSSFILANERSTHQLNKTSADGDYTHYTTVGQIGMTVTNFGIIGEGYNNPDQPSCMYKQYPDNLKEQVEHFSYAGLWVGGKVNGTPHVSTAIVDGVFPGASEGFEFTFNEDSIKVQSSITTDKKYSPKAVSHQDFITSFRDYNHTAENHNPLGIDVYLESYVWNYSFANAFVILNYKIVNNSQYIANGPFDIDNVYVGLWVDASIGNMNYTSIYEPGGGWSWYDNLNGFDETVYDPMPNDEYHGYPRNIAYQYDVDGDNGYAESYVGFRCIGADPVPRDKWTSYYYQWPWTTSADLDYPDYVMPMDDGERYQRMTHSVTKGTGEDYNSEGYPNQPKSWMILVSSGPFGSEQSTEDSTNWILKPNDTINVVYAVTAGGWATGEIEDTRNRRELLYANSDWAQKAYNGEDNNGNGQLDIGEDQDGDNIIDRYILPAPPPSPTLYLESEAGKINLYWDNVPETSKDPISRKQDFEGYRIYARRKTSTSESEWTQLAQFDIKNEFGYNTGFEYIRIKDEQGNPSFKIVNSDTFYYKFENDAILNGWPNKNVYAITSYDFGDPNTGLKSLESSKLENKTYVIGGRQVNDDFDFKVGVYPNPYRASAEWDGIGGVRDRMIWFTGLPSKSVVRIYTLAGELVKKIEHNADTYNGSDIQRLRYISEQNAVFSGGEHAWDLITDDDQAIATGLYLYSVKNTDSGEIKTDKFLVIK